MTGDYRGRAFGPFEATLDGTACLRTALKGPVYGVLGNHDTIRLLPALDDLGIRILVNESETIERRNQRIHLVGIDDAHFYRMDNIEKATAAIPSDEFSILISHTPEIYRQAAYADFNVLISGRTHGGQICLPSGIPLTLDSDFRDEWGLGLGNITR
jgi:predicted MPP superfamily phosphohydrolase